MSELNLPPTPEQHINDQSIGVHWPIVIGKEPMLSKKDASASNLSECKYLLG